MWDSSAVPGYILSAGVLLKFDKCVMLKHADVIKGEAE